MSTPIHTLHPRRLFCSEPTEVDATSCLRPSVIAQQERGIVQQRSPFYVQPLLAPSPIPSSGLSVDVDTLVDFVNGLAESTNIECGSVKIRQLEPLREALIALQRRFVESGSTIVGVTPVLPSPKWVEATPGPTSPENPITSPESIPTSYHKDPRIEEQVEISSHHSILTSSVTSDVEHLRTIQKELRSLFDERVQSNQSTSQSTLSPIHRSTATRISRALCDSATIASSVSDDLGNLTLSPTSDLFDRESVQRNPWFKQNPKRNNREIKADGAKTIEALQNARKEKMGAPKNDLLVWLQKHANQTPKTTAKGLASIYSARSQTHFQEPARN
jgi:hypothetical protein